jgi:F-type H+-transporting ATPase subunit epsilon
VALKLHFSLVSPERELFSGEVDQVDAPGAEGDFGVLAGHAPFMTTLKPGRVHVHIDGEVRLYDIHGGFADVTPRGLTILAEKADEVDLGTPPPFDAGGGSARQNTSAPRRPPEGPGPA